MDGFTIGIIIKTLLASAGLKATLGIVCVGGFFYMCFKTAQSVGGFFERIIANRDAMLATLTRDIKASDERRAVHDQQTAAILATINTKIDGQMQASNESSRKFDEMQKDITLIKGAVA